jgi:hypothetical protein
MMRSWQVIVFIILVGFYLDFIGFLCILELLRLFVEEGVLWQRLFADELTGFLFLLPEVLFVLFDLSFENGDFAVFFLYFLFFYSDVGFEVQQFLLSDVDVILQHLYDGFVLFFDVFEGRSAVEI